MPYLLTLPHQLGSNQEYIHIVNILSFFLVQTFLGIILFISTLLCFSSVSVDFSPKSGYFDPFWAQKGGFGGYKIIKVGTACKLYQYITKIIIILFIPSLLCFSGVSVNFPPKNRHFDPFWAQKGVGGVGWGGVGGWFGWVGRGG